MESIDGFCLSCEHKHRSVSQCSYCDCNWDNTMEDSMIKKIWAKIKAIWNSIVSKFWQD